MVSCSVRVESIPILSAVGRRCVSKARGRVESSQLLDHGWRQLKLRVLASNHGISNAKQLCIERLLLCRQRRRGVRAELRVRPDVHGHSSGPLPCFSFPFFLPETIGLYRLDPYMAIDKLFYD